MLPRGFGQRSLRGQITLVAACALLCCGAGNLASHTTRVGSYVWVDYGRVQLYCGRNYPLANSYGFHLTYSADRTWSWWVSGHARPLEAQWPGGPS